MDDSDEILEYLAKKLSAEETRHRVKELGDKIENTTGFGQR